MNQENKFHPFEDVGGPILITRIESKYPDNLVVIENITDTFDGKEQRKPGNGGVGILFTYLESGELASIQLVEKLPRAERASLDFVRSTIDSFWQGKIDALSFSRVPGLTVSGFCGKQVQEGEAIQWNREDLDKLVAIVEKTFCKTNH